MLEYSNDIPFSWMGILNSGSASFPYVAVVICSALIFYKYCYPGHALPLPPGPVPLPVIGNLHQLTGGNPFEQFEKWHKKYGALISIRAGQRTIIVISSYEIAHDLLDKQSAVYSSRPKLNIASKHLARDMSMALMPCSKKWQTHRRMVVSLLNSAATKRYQAVLDIESKQVVHELLTSHDFSSSFERYITSLLFTLAYGIRVESITRPEISEMRYVLHCLKDGLNNVTMAVVELFPLLDHLPRFMAPWKQFWQERHNRTIKFMLQNLQYARSKQKSSWTWAREVQQALNHAGKDGDSEVAYLVGTMNEAGIETTPSAMCTAIKALLLNPAAAKRAQQEIDTIVGPDRLPQVDDAPEMPFMEALIEEVLRWQPVTPLGAPHSTDTDQEYMGYRIPRGSIIMQNYYGMAHDSNTCPEPYKFNPERWLQDPDLRVFSPFGYGRRKCPGEQMARNSIFIVLSRILWGYNINHVVRDGQTIEVDEWDIEHHFTSAPAPFEVSFEVRDEHRRKIIEREFQSMEKNASEILKKVAP
ncbi:hypothetical protein EYB26_002703 [Talaromyces marneffei]|uniref:uncharacterized protein n=1 Tax=Talaromyces marneffei TaxID=37727 RepID=UPI0012A97AFB|nr:uncharacterized protein EYB26_002703 [Talaromyces marneffei]QGA15047.1 hypothetical protein EYB26_002703 [Talaromyces marneffei]